jgi:hypothetical protein
LIRHELLQCGGGHGTGWMMQHGLLHGGRGRGGHGTSHVRPLSRGFGWKVERVFLLERRIRTGSCTRVRATGAFLVGLGRCRLVHALVSNCSCLLHCSAIASHCHQTKRRQHRRRQGMRYLRRGAMFRRAMVVAVDDRRTVPTRGVLLLLPARRFGRRRFRLDKAWNVVVQVQSAHGNVVVGGTTAAAPTGWHLRRRRQRKRSHQTVFGRESIVVMDAIVFHESVVVRLANVRLETTTPWPRYWRRRRHGRYRDGHGGGCIHGLESTAHCCTEPPHHVVVGHLWRRRRMVQL